LFTSLNPSECPVTIVGKLANLKKIQFADVANKFAPIDEQLWEGAMTDLASGQRYTYRVLQTIQIKLILLCVWAERAILGSAKLV
jgi:hypothetical protein